MEGNFQISTVDIVTMELQLTALEVCFLNGNRLRSDVCTVVIVPARILLYSTNRVQIEHISYSYTCEGYHSRKKN